ncbi:MAG: hypothetical protein HOM62_23540 [Rhodospirillaceae bacterium]|nr:hypothetical protein [Rhodospirillaceae bacterium]MBT5083554.1 hypothetical protein [Rhodospirillaceae bacterium]MBT5879189.1 hypothetical protein [Rhodospirillaceae bacterium]
MFVVVAVASCALRMRFSELLAGRLAEKFPDNRLVNIWGDPAGSQRAQTDERICLEIVTEYAGIKARPAPSNDVTMRREAVGQALSRMIDGRPGFLVSPSCTMLRKGFVGGFHYKRVKVTGDERYHDKPSKNKYSHPHDALQYLLLGGGEGNVVLRKQERRQRGPERHMDAEMMSSPYDARPDFG